MKTIDIDIYSALRTDEKIRSKYYLKILTHGGMKNSLKVSGLLMRLY